MSEAAEATSTPVLIIDGGRATIRLNRPKHLNRLQPDDLEALLKLFDRLEADPLIRVLVLTGTGRAFSAGYDLGSIAERAISAPEQQTAGSAFEVVANRLEDLGDADDLPAQWRRLWRLDRSGAGLRLPHRRRYRRDVHAGGAARAALLHQRHQTLRLAAGGRQREEIVSHRAEDRSQLEMLRIGYLTACVPAESLDEEVDRLATILAGGNAPAAIARHEARHQRIFPRRAR